MPTLLDIQTLNDRVAQLEARDTGEGNVADTPIQPVQLTRRHLQLLIDQPDLIVTRQAHQ